MSARTLFAGASFVTSALVAIACSDAGARSGFDDTPPTLDPKPPPGFQPDAPCPNGTKTTVSGRAWDPAGDLPLYNAIIYAPTKELEPIASGASCERCGVPVSGAPHAATLSKSDGTFSLEVTPGTDVPIVVQIGKWRRLAKIPKVEACKDNTLSDSNLTRLPRNASEGNLPRIAIETGEYDALECLLLRLGLDASEITAPSGSGHVQLYRAGEGAVHQSGAPVAGKTLWSSPSTLASFDAVFFECAGPDYPTQMGATERANVAAYANAGGRIFTTDYAGLAWIREGAAPFPSTATWTSGSGRTSFVTDVDRTFPKGKAFGEWLYAVHATTQPTAGMTVRSETTIVPKASAIASSSERWLYAVTGGSPLQYSFNTPVGKPAEEQCGRVVFNDFHVSDTSGDYASGGPRVFPNGCKTTSPTPQELALAFMIFDLGSCIQDATKDPIPPR